MTKTMLSLFPYRVLVISLVLFGISVCFRHYGPQLQANNIPDTPEAHEVLTALERAFAVLDTPFEQLDLNQLSDVLINHPNYANHLSADELAELKEYTRQVQGEAASQALGYLTAMRIKRMNQQHGLKLLKATRAKAKAEQREVTSEELKQLTEQNDGMEPYLPEQSSAPQDPPFKRRLKYFDVTLEGDKAEVVFDDMTTTRTALLIRVNGRWFVAGIF